MDAQNVLSRAVWDVVSALLRVAQLCREAAGSRAPTSSPAAEFSRAFCPGFSWNGVNFLPSAVFWIQYEDGADDT